MQKRLLTIQDFSCLGRCSLTVAQPTISACGIECVAIPTAVLSNHTQYKSWTFLDLTNELSPIVKKWEDYNHHFEMISTGYLSTAQIDIVIDIINHLKEKDTKIYIDPAMADNGKLYPGFGPEHVTKMVELCRQGDYVKPNVTEACLMCHIDYPTKPVGFEFYLHLAHQLRELGMKNIILTGIKLHAGKIGVLLLEESKKEPTFVEYDLVDAYLHGTGDLFSAAVASMLTLGKSLEKAVEIGHEYVVKSIRYTIDDGVDGLLYGPEFERAIPDLIKMI